MTLPGLILLLLLPATPQDNPVERLLRQLGHEQAKVREEAARGLVEIGKPALPLLREAAKGGDAETQARALAVIKDIELRLSNGQDLWTRPGKALTPMVQDAGKLYYATESEAEGKGTLLCIDAATGRGEWSIALAGAPTNLWAREGVVHYQQEEEFFVDARTGKPLSSFHIGFTGYPRLELLGSVAVAVHSGWPSECRAYDVPSGRVLWSRKGPEIGFPLPLGSFKKACLVYEQKQVAALESGTGRPLWERALPENEQRPFSLGSPGPEQRVLFDDQFIYFSGSKVRKWDQQGRDIWAAEILDLNGCGPRLLAQDAGTVYGAMTDSRVVALAKENGSRTWVDGEKRDGWNVILGMQLIERRLLVLTSLGFSKSNPKYVVRCLDPETGKLLWTLPCSSSPLPRTSFRGWIYLAGTDGLYRADLKTGKALLLSRPLPNGTPLLLGDTLYCSSSTGVYAVKLPD
jgi:outer membrane protein assembly factor BamB